MSNEFKHKALPWDTRPTRKRWQAEDAHQADGQTTGDILYFDGSHWKRTDTLPSTVVVAVDHGNLTGITADAHHNEDHAARHQNGGADEISIAGLSGAPADTVNKAGNQTVAGVKTFSSFPVTPSSAPTTDYQVANKKYVDDSAGLDSTIKCVASDALSASADTERTSASESYVKVKEISTLRAGTYRVKFDLKIPEEISVYGRIYKNGVAHGTERISLSPTYETFSEDLTFAANDLIQLYYKTGNSVAPVYTRNFRLYCHMAPDTTVALN